MGKAPKQTHFFLEEDTTQHLFGGCKQVPLRTKTVPAWIGQLCCVLIALSQYTAQRSWSTLIDCVNTHRQHAQAAVGGINRCQLCKKELKKASFVLRNLETGSTCQWKWKWIVRPCPAHVWGAQSNKTAEQGIVTFAKALFQVDTNILEVPLTFVKGMVCLSFISLLCTPLSKKECIERAVSSTKMGHLIALFCEQGLLYSNNAFQTQTKRPNQPRIYSSKAPRSSLERAWRPHNGSLQRCKASKEQVKHGLKCALNCSQNIPTKLLPCKSCMQQLLTRLQCA